MDQNIDNNIISDDISNDLASRQLVKYKENPIKDISLLTKDFDLSSMPPNYMRRRSKIEEIIYRAVFSQNNHKSPFSSFKIAKNCLPDLDKINIVTGINNLKKIIKSIHSNDEQISIMVHKVADTYLLDEFDIDALFLRHQHYADWDWLRNFIKQECFQLAKPDLSRASLSMRDLYAKFLYHSVSQPSIEMPNTELENELKNDSSSQLSVIKKPIQMKMDSKFSGSGHRFDAKNEDFLNLVDWKLEDLSFVVGSDLSIFGTKSHPCISLRLSPCHEPINILTGIDMWLENMLNEVPEIAMCYHDQGIVMREYEILKTNDIPKLASFNEDEVKSIAKNLSHFLSTNATKEGHTYWLFKEVDSTTVKLYDLTNIWERENYKNQRDLNKVQNSCDNNPFIIPVAILCYKMAENRVNQWYRARDKRGKTKLTSSQFNKEMVDNKLADNQYYFNEIFRLLKNCINLLMKTDKHEELVRKAMLMMCQLYLEVDQITLNNLQYQQDQESSGVAKLDLNDLKKDDIKFSTESTTVDNPLIDDLTLMGSKLFDLCAQKNTQEILEQAIKLIDITNFNDQKTMIVDKELLSNNTLLCESNQQSTESHLITMENRQMIIKENLTDSIIMCYMRQCIDKEVTKANVEELKIILKSGFMVALLDEEVLSDDVKLLLEHECYYALIEAFLRWHCDMQGLENTSETTVLSNMDKKALGYHYDKRKEQLLNAIFVFKSLFMSEKQRSETKIDNKIHQGWYQAILYLTSMAYKLSQISSLTKTKRNIIQRGMPILINFLVNAIVILYNQKVQSLEDENTKETTIIEWCKKTVVPSIKWMSDWSSHEDFEGIIEDSLVSLVWSNQAKLHRLAAAIMCDKEHNYLAIDAYTNAIDCLLKSCKKKPTQMTLNIKCDRIELCIIVVEKAYSSLDPNGTNKNESIQEMNRAVECAQRILRIESPFQSIAMINRKLTSLRLRINFVRYYLNLNSNRSLNYDQVVSDLQNDLALILNGEDCLSRCKETTLIHFYMFKIQSDCCEILSMNSIKQFLRDNWTHIHDNLYNDNYINYFNGDGKSLISGIYHNIIQMVRAFIRKCKGETRRKKKSSHIDMHKINELEMYLSNDGDESKSNLSMLELMKILLIKINTIMDP